MAKWWQTATPVPIKIATLQWHFATSLKSSRILRGHNILGEQIRHARLRTRPLLSQADLAAKLTVRGVPMDRTTITRIENGERYLRDFEIQALAKVLRVSVSSLFREGASSH